MAATTGAFKKKPTGITYEQIVRDVRAGNIKPIYYLMGEESYYIDRVSEFIVQMVLTPEEREFGLCTLYGADINVDDLITSARAFPMGSRYSVFLIKEAQNMKHLERLEMYFKQIQSTTILIFCHKHGALDRRLKVATLIGKEGVMFESKKLYDNQLPPFVVNYLKRKKIGIEPPAAEMVAEYVGSDLNRLASELDKLVLSLPKNDYLVTVGLVREHIGVSKNFNIFELQDALIEKNVLKAFQIAKYFDSNPKENPIQMVLPSLFNLFSRVMMAYYAPERTERGIAQWLSMTEWQVRKNVLPALQAYSGIKVMQILSEIRRTDARSKGVGNPSIASGELMKELIYFILH